MLLEGADCAPCGQTRPRDRALGRPATPTQSAMTASSNSTECCKAKLPLVLTCALPIGDGRNGGDGNGCHSGHGARGREGLVTVCAPRAASSAGRTIALSEGGADNPWCSECSSVNPLGTNASIESFWCRFVLQEQTETAACGCAGAVAGAWSVRTDARIGPVSADRPEVRAGAMLAGHAWPQ